MGGELTFLFFFRFFQSPFITTAQLKSLQLVAGPFVRKSLWKRAPGRTDSCSSLEDPIQPAWPPAGDAALLLQNFVRIEVIKGKGYMKYLIVLTNEKLNTSFHISRNNKVIAIQRNECPKSMFRDAKF